MWESWFGGQGVIISPILHLMSLRGSWDTTEILISRSEAYETDMIWNKILNIQ